MSLLRSIALAFRAATGPGTPTMGERLAALPRLAAATLQGRYTGSSGSRLLLLVGAVLYVLSPVDVLPEALLGVFGLADDALVLSWIASRVVLETEEFLAWERSRGPAAASASAGASSASCRTVPGHVVG